MLNETYYRNPAEAKRALRLYRTVVASLVERSPDEAKSWLERDAKRAAGRALELSEASRDAANQLDIFTNNPVGPDDPKALMFARESKTERTNAELSSIAARMTGYSMDRLDALIDGAAKQLSDLKDIAAQDKKDRKVRKRAQEQESRSVVA